MRVPVWGRHSSEHRRLHRLARTCRNRVRELDIIPGDDLECVRAKISDRFGRQIALVPFPLSDSAIHGILISTDTVDYVVYEQHTTALHQNHIILHEFSHIMFGHYQNAQPAPTEALVSLAPGGEWGSATVLGRQAYDDPQELEAELTATILGECVSSGTEFPVPNLHDADERISRVLRTFSLEP
ncbi:hypothetical protein K7711_08280 [Nocardia sp. CA2R105]|uniref:hypothetical protein n=1 Tax=Nocardia coffeae TaxID=2873381 RepID=UPI001CA73FAF|nr:hypothetical protein [Nocardia coffeae]MBY8856470.1 hypothetical protein [Nocardia coffeae]